jgi:hypothetical protein
VDVSEHEDDGEELEEELSGRLTGPLRFPFVMLGQDLYRQAQVGLVISRLTQQDLAKRVGVVIHVGARGLDARYY